MGEQARVGGGGGTPSAMGLRSRRAFEGRPLIIQACGDAGAVQARRAPRCSSASWTCASFKVLHGLVSVVQPSNRTCLQRRCSASSAASPTVGVCRGFLPGRPAKKEPHRIVAAAAISAAAAPRCRTRTGWAYLTAIGPSRISRGGLDPPGEIRAGFAGSLFGSVI